MNVIQKDPECSGETAVTLDDALLEVPKWLVQGLKKNCCPPGIVTLSRVNIEWCEKQQHKTLSMHRVCGKKHLVGERHQRLDWLELVGML